MKALAEAFRPILSALVLAVCTVAYAESDTNHAPATLRSEDANAQEIMRAYLQLQEQIHETQLAVEQTRKEAQEASARSAEALAGRLHAIEAALSSQRARELEAMQSSNRVMLFMAGSFAVVGFVAMLVIAYFQWRTVHGLGEISSVLPPLRALGPGSALAALPAPGQSQAGTSGEVEKSSSRLIGALEQLEKRILDLERSSHPVLEAGASPGLAATKPQANGNGTGHDKIVEVHEAADLTSEGNGKIPAEEVHALIGEGQKLLDQDQPAEALARFDQVLGLQPGHAEALVKKGVALERLQKLMEAIECYDAAIKADNTLTIAYLHKGGAFNRLERFTEALECYEQALRTQEKRGL